MSAGASPFLRVFSGGLLALTLAACGGAALPDEASEESDLSSRACSPTGKRAHPLVLNVEPDDASGPWIAALTGATTRVRVLIYQMGKGPILDGLVSAAKAGLDVRV